MKKCALLMVCICLASVTWAQPLDPRPMPNRVRSFLDKLVGEWDAENDQIKVKVTFEWDEEQNFIVGRAQGTFRGKPYTDAAFWHWDGLSKDGIVIYWVAQDGYGTTNSKLVSKNVIEGKGKGIDSGKEVSDLFRAESHGKEKLTFRMTDSYIGDEKQPDSSVVLKRIDQETSGQVEVVFGMKHKQSKVEKEIWDTVKAYWKNTSIEDLMSYVHPEFLGWNVNEPMPDNNATVRLMLTNELDNKQALLVKIAPTGLKTHDDIAIVNYYYTFIYKDTDGEQQSEQGRFTDVLKKENDKWLLIADHGGAIAPSEDE